MGLDRQPSAFPRQHLLHFQPVIITEEYEIIIIMYKFNDRMYLKYML
jgi:hypothetical protein